jgi:hypothetical protein
MMRAEHFHSLDETGDAHALHQAVRAADKIFIGDILVSTRETAHLDATVASGGIVRLVFEDCSYLAISRIGEDQLFVEWGVVGVEQKDHEPVLSSQPLPVRSEKGAIQ